MNRKRVAGIALVFVLAVFALAHAHEGHVHKVMGTVTSVQGTHVEVKTTDGKTVTVMLDQKTTITRGKTKLDATALKPGERVSVDATQDKNMMMAQAIKLGEVPTTAKK